MVCLYPVEGFRGEMCSILLYGRRGKMSSTTDVDSGTAIRLVYEVGVFLFSDPVLKDWRWTLYVLRQLRTYPHFLFIFRFGPLPKRLNLTCNEMVYGFRVLIQKWDGDHFYSFLGMVNQSGTICDKLIIGVVNRNESQNVHLQFQSQFQSQFIHLPKKIIKSHSTLQK